jgi:hypothetical protein
MHPPFWTYMGRQGIQWKNKRNEIKEPHKNKILMVKDYHNIKTIHKIMRNSMFLGLSILKFIIIQYTNKLLNVIYYPFHKKKKGNVM